MKILLTGSTGYIGNKLLTVLLDAGHEVVCCVRNKALFCPPALNSNHIEIIEVDLLQKSSLKSIPLDIDVAYYLVHSMASSMNFDVEELECARNFRERLSDTKVKQVIYLGAIVNEIILSAHFSSRKNVEAELHKGTYNCTSFRAGITIGSGSASFEIIRDLVEKLPIMVAPRWLNTLCQPIGINDVLDILFKALLNEKTYNQNFDIGGPDVLTYKQMLLEYARVQGLRRAIVIVPVMTPRLSSYWLYFVTSTTYWLAINLVNSMKIPVICRNNDINTILNVKPASYTDSLKTIFFTGNSDTCASSNAHYFDLKFIEPPTFGCFVDQRKGVVYSRINSLEKIWSIGGEQGWYFANWLWKLRGYLDKWVGGVGHQRGRISQTKIQVGDVIDFWKVLYANKEEARLVLFAEMKLPGEAWLEFKCEGNILTQTATFRPRGLLGRLYWVSVYPAHGYIFKGLLAKLTAK